MCIQNRGLACEWRKREFNLEADWACTAALDQQTSFFWHDEVPANLEGKNIIFYSDGGKREFDPAHPTRCVAATGWAIRVDHGSRSTLLAMGGTLREAHFTVPRLELQAMLDVHKHWRDVLAGQEPEATLRSLLIVDNMLSSLIKAVSRFEA